MNASISFWNGFSKLHGRANATNAATIISASPDDNPLSTRTFAKRCAPSAIHDHKLSFSIRAL